MRHYYTPLRYPGGKARLAPIVMRLLEENGLRDVTYVEPYAGGAGIALVLLFEDYAASIHLNDLSRPIYAFWHTVLYETEWLCERIAKVQLTVREWHRQRRIYKRQSDAVLRDLGFAAFFLNRTNRSGILGGGVIGGLDQTGPWTIGARFGREGLIRRVKKIQRHASRIRLYQMDGLEFTRKVVPRLPKPAFIFYDPPYIEPQGEGIRRRMYLNTYRVADHVRLARTVARVKQPWVVTYDGAALRYDLHRSARRMVYTLTYSAQNRERAEEVMYFSDALQLPDLAALRARGIRLKPKASRVGFTTPAGVQRVTG